MRVFVLSIGVLALVSCKQAPAEHAAVTRPEAARIAEKAEQNFTTGRVEDVIRQYAEGAVMFDAGHPTFSTDRKVQTAWARDFVSMKPADYHVPDRQIQLLGPDAFISSGTEIFTVESGTSRPTISARFTDVFQRSPDGNWRIVHEHVSMPPPPPSTQPAN